MWGWLEEPLRNGGSARCRIGGPASVHRRHAPIGANSEPSLCPEYHSTRQPASRNSSNVSKVSRGTASRPSGVSGRSAIWPRNTVAEKPVHPAKPRASSIVPESGRSSPLDRTSGRNGCHGQRGGSAIIARLKVRAESLIVLSPTVVETARRGVSHQDAKSMRQLQARSNCVG